MNLNLVQALRRAFERIFGIGDYRRYDSGAPVTWKLLLGSPGAHVSIACRPAPGGRERVLFRHSFSGYARIELQVRQIHADGRTQVHHLRSRGHSFATLSSSNLIAAGPDSQLLIENIRVRFDAHGLEHDLFIDERNKRYELLREGQPFAHGPQYLLALDELPPCVHRPLLMRPTGMMSMAATL